MAKDVSQSVIRGLKLLDCFCETEELGITELSALLGVGKTVVARLVGSLESCGYLHQNAQTQKYRLGVKLMLLGTLASERNEIVPLAKPHLNRLSEEFQATTHLAVLDNNAALIISKVSRGPVIYMSSRVGTTIPAHACATGKCLLAHSGHDVIQGFLNSRPLERFTEYTITDPGALLQEFVQIRKQGYALDHEESTIGLCCVSVPILDAQGSPLAAISLSGQSKEIMARKDQILSGLRGAIREICVQF